MCTAAGSPDMGLVTAGFLIFHTREAAGSTSRTACSSEVSSSSEWKKPMPYGLSSPGGMLSTFTCTASTSCLALHARDTIQHCSHTSCTTKMLLTQFVEEVQKSSIKGIILFSNRAQKIPGGCKGITASPDPPQ